MTGLACINSKRIGGRTKNLNYIYGIFPLYLDKLFLFAFLTLVLSTSLSVFANLGWIAFIPLIVYALALLSCGIVGLLSSVLEDTCENYYSKSRENLDQSETDYFNSYPINPTIENSKNNKYLFYLFCNFSKTCPVDNSPICTLSEEVDSEYIRVLKNSV